MSDDQTQPIPTEEATPVQPRQEEPTTVEDAEVEPPEVEAPHVETPTAPLPPVPPVPPAPTEPTGHIRVTAATPQPEPRTAPRVGTVVWGLVIAAVGVGLLSVAWGAHLDAELALIVLLGAAGVALLVGSLVGMRRSRNRMEGRG